jgi:hypothetical protein
VLEVKRAGRKGCKGRVEGRRRRMKKRRTRR